ncbi:hydantoinase B/oxoprolinase family protein [Rhodobium gokarnense]|uniref:N-methylhydantoinase B n=1 Tax=Rhodobium gokarnense TaxID=364296 RepID=A0ABT3HBA0_9HYPH|nr:hydantoinase B/oxoprolinase family protein [Rhodobium gokarnense]MCW2307678.1 N-methylhydantoinase B [Rhodobium gokarnense]
MDPIRTAIMYSRFSAVVEEASTTLHRTAHTTFVKLVQDYQCALATPDGDIFAYPSGSGVTTFIGLPLHGVLRWLDFDTLQPGDVILTNDPFATDGVVTHQMDVTMVRPIFRDGRLIAFAWSFVHASDIGGAVAGSISPSFTESYQEGLRLRPVHLVRAGKIDETIKNILFDNSRAADDVWGDMKAMLAAMASMDQRLNALCDRFGTEQVEAGMQDVMALAERKARNVIRDIPDGTYDFSDFVEGLGEGEYYQVHVSMTVDGDTVHFDFAGTDPQMPSAYNFICGDRTHPYIVQGLMNLILTRAPDAPKNAGLLRPITMHAPRGSLINAELPAAMGSRVASGLRVYDAVIGCLNKALPDGLMAAGAGMAGIVVVNAIDPVTGKERVTVVNPICGGGGGRRIRDGIDGIDGRVGGLKSVPAEIVEAETVLRVRRFELLPDSQAPGKWRSGAAVVLELESTGISAQITARGMNRFHFRPWGVKGGEAGRLANISLTHDDGTSETIDRITVLPLKEGDILTVETPAGGSYGPAFDRDPALVLADVEEGLVSRDKALEAYGVVIVDGQVDADATEREREARRPANAAPEDIVFGPERQDFDRLRPEPVRVHLANRLLQENTATRGQLVKVIQPDLARRTAPLDIAAADDLVERHLRRIRNVAPAPGASNQIN